MKIKFLLSCFLLLTFCIISKSQTITVLSSEDKKPVPFAHIIIKPLNHEGKEQVFLTDTNGTATVTLSALPAGRQVVEGLYQLSISIIGFEKLIDTLKVSNYQLPITNFYLTPQLQTLNEVVITGQYAPNSPEKAVHKIKIIDAKRIEAQAAVNLRDVLSNEMNIRLSQDNILGSSMSMQGISGENVKILIDGVPVIGRQNGNVDLSQINLNNIQRIEIIEGPMSVSYGTNALAGTINLITKKNLKSTIETGISSYYESTGNYNLNGRVSFSKNKNTVTFSGGRNFFDGWNDGDKITLRNKPQLADSTRYQSWKPKEQYFADLQYSYTFDRLMLNYKGSYFTEKIINRGLPRAPYGETAFDDFYNTRRFDNALFLNGEIAKNKNLNFLVSYNDYRRIKNTYYKDLTTLQQVLSENSSDQDTSHFTLINSRATYSTSDKNKIINYEIGYDINVENGYGIRIKDTHQMIGDYAVFSTAEYSPLKSQALIIRLGLRYAYNTAYKSPLIPSLNLKYSIKNLTLRASYARGFRAPSLKELYFYFVDINHNIKGSEELKAEYSHNFNLTATYSKTKGDKMMKVELSGFYNNIRNMITLAFASATEYTYINIGKYQTLGIQLNTEYNIRHLKFSIGGSYIGRYNQLSETADVAIFSYSPELRGNVFYEFKKWNMTTALFYKYAGRMPGFVLDENNEVQQNFISDYHTADFTLSKLFWKKRINLSIGSKNLFNVKNVAALAMGSAHSAGGSSIPVSTGRTYFVKLDFNISSKK